MIAELSDVLFLTACAAAILGGLVLWAAVAFGLAVLIGRVIRGRDTQVPVEPETREIPVIRMVPTDTVQMQWVRR